MQSETIGKLAGALAKAQGMMRGAKKDSANPHLRSKYADLESCWDACREALSANEIAVVQVPESIGDALHLRTILIHSSGEYISGSVPVIYGDSKGLNPMQAMGSALTYARRYGLCALVGISPEDDDAASAGAPTPREQAPAKPRSDMAREWLAKPAGQGMDALKAAFQALDHDQREIAKPFLDGIYKSIAEKADAAKGVRDESSDRITDEQAKNLNRMFGAKKLNRDHIKAALKKQLGIDSTKLILKSDYQDIWDKAEALADFGASLAATEEV